MKTLVLYDSAYGNTEKVARAIAGAIPGDVKVLRVNEATPLELKSIDLLIVGSPTQGGRPTPATLTLLSKLQSLEGTRVAAFDTRLSTRWVGIFGYAAGKIAETLKAKGANLVAAPEAFFVKGKEGPLKDGELERAAGWAKSITEARQAQRLEE